LIRLFRSKKKEQPQIENTPEGGSVTTVSPPGATFTGSVRKLNFGSEKEMLQPQIEKNSEGGSVVVPRPGATFTDSVLEFWSDSKLAEYLRGYRGVTRNSTESVAASGSAAAFTEDGYQLVASLRSNEQMETYVRRLLASDGMTVREEDRAELSGFVAYYSGTISRQSLKRLRTELATVPWAVRATNSDVDSALETLQHQRMSSSSDVSAYTLEVASALAGSHVMTAYDFRSRPIQDLVDELKVASNEKAKVVFQLPDGKVEVTDPVNLIKRIEAEAAARDHNLMHPEFK